MFKKIVVIVLALLLCASFAFSATKKKPVKKAEVQQPVKKVVVVQKDAEFKEKLAIGYDVIGKNVYLRFWPNNNMGMEFTGGLGFTSGSGASSFLFNAGMNMIFPMYNEGSFYLNLDPGIRLGFNNQSITVAGTSVGTSVFGVILGCWLEGEVFLTAVSKNLSVSSSVGAGIEISSTSVTGGGSVTTFGISAATPDFAVVPLVVRYYF